MLLTKKFNTRGLRIDPCATRGSIFHPSLKLIFIFGTKYSNYTAILLMGKIVFKQPFRENSIISLCFYRDLCRCF